MEFLEDEIDNSGILNYLFKNNTQWSAHVCNKAAQSVNTIIGDTKRMLRY